MPAKGERPQGHWPKIKVSIMLFRVLLGILALQLGLSAQAQFSLSGRVSDQEGEGLPSAHIYLKGTQVITTSNVDGDYVVKNLKAGEYDVEVIAGTEMPRSRSEKARILMQLSEMGKIPNTPTGTEILLDALDIPDKTAIMEANEEAVIAAPKINIPLDLAGKIFKDMPPIYQDEFLQQFGFTPIQPQEGVPNEGIGINA